MTSEKQKKAAAQNIKKAQAVWQSLSSEERSSKQPKGRRRQKPGTTGHGEYYHVIVRPKNAFKVFRTHDVGSTGHTKRVAGQLPTGNWETQKWLIPKEDAYVNRSGYLKSDREKTQEILNQLQRIPRHSRGDVFVAKPRKKTPEKDKPTTAQKRARKKNIQKAQEAKRSLH